MNGEPLTTPSSLLHNTASSRHRDPVEVVRQDGQLSDIRLKLEKPFSDSD